MVGSSGEDQLSQELLAILNLKVALLFEEWKRYVRRQDQGEADWSVLERMRPWFPTCSNTNKPE
jgi:hypothetical protein